MKNEKKQREYETLRKLIDNEENDETRAILIYQALQILNDDKNCSMHE